MIQEEVSEAKPEKEDVTDAKTPQEIIEEAVKKMNAALASELLSEIVEMDPFGFDSIYLQAKQYKDGTVGRADVQKFVGALAG